MVEVLESVAVGLIAVHVLHQRHDRHRRLQRFGETRDEQRCGRPILRRYDSGAVGQTRVTVGHRRPGILGAIGELADAAILGRQQQGGRQALRKNHLDAVPLQRGCDRLRDGHLVRSGPGLLRLRHVDPAMRCHAALVVCWLDAISQRPPRLTQKRVAR